MKNNNTASVLVSLLGINSDTTSPTVTITSTESSPSYAYPIPLTITFSEPVTGFAVGDLTLANCTAGEFAGSGAVYTVNLYRTGAAITVDIAGGVCVDAAGNGNTAATQFAITSGLLFWDTFTDADNTLLSNHTPNYGTWAKVADDLEIVGNACTMKTSNGSYRGNAGVTAYTITSNIRLGAAGEYIQHNFSADLNYTKYLYIQISSFRGAPDEFFCVAVGGGATVLTGGSLDIDTLSANSDHTLAITVLGDGTFTVKIDGTTYATGTTDLTGRTYFGAKRTGTNQSSWFYDTKVTTPL